MLEILPSVFTGHDYTGLRARHEFVKCSKK